MLQLPSGNSHEESSDGAVRSGGGSVEVYGSEFRGSSGEPCSLSIAMVRGPKRQWI